MYGHQPDTSNNEKYTQGAGNPVVKYLMRMLFDRVSVELDAVNPRNMLDAGCGEGHAIEWLGSSCPQEIYGFDVNPEAVEYCQQRHKHGIFTTQNIYSLDYEADYFDVVLCMEVLEHVEKPENALKELARVSKRSLILTVPNEPWFQLGNFFRGKYLATMGNHPEHIQHWGTKSFPRFIDESLGVRNYSVNAVGPWLVATLTL
jgi:2-polyprenyl-3-methyl-5-hydroxy-6-metoxy-1,4-benzoquinol methylase